MISDTTDSLGGMKSVLHLIDGPLFTRDFSNFLVQLSMMCDGGCPFVSWNKEGGSREQNLHLFQRSSCSLRHESPEEDRIGEIADHKDKEVSPSNIVNGRGGDLSDHGVECE